jgi:uncharacterized membrane protein YqjE
MESTTGSVAQLGAAAKKLALRLAAVGENRLELLAVEMEQESERQRHALLLAVGVGVFGLLGALTFTAVIVVWLWVWSPVAPLVTLTVLYAAAGTCFYRRLARLLQNWKILPASLEQIRKDLAGLERTLK